jgi:hypothetical protein
MGAKPSLKPISMREIPSELISLHARVRYTGRPRVASKLFPMGLLGSFLVSVAPTGRRQSSLRDSGSLRKVKAARSKIPPNQVRARQDPACAKSKGNEPGSRPSKLLGRPCPHEVETRHGGHANRHPVCLGMPPTRAVRAPATH